MMDGLFSLVRTRPWSLGAAAVLSILSATAGLAPALLVYLIAVQVLSKSPDLEWVSWYAALGLAAAVVKHGLFAASTCFAHVAAFGILYDLRVAMARKMARVPLGFFARRQAGDLHKAMTEDVGGLEAFLAHMLPDAVAAFTVPVVAMVTMFVLDWRLALAAFAAVPVAVFVQYTMLNSDTQQLYEQYHDVTEATKRAVHEYLRGIHVIKAFGLEARSFTELSDAVTQMTTYVEDYASKSAPPFIVAMKLMSGGTNALFIIPVGLWLHAQGTLEVSMLVLFLLISTQVLSPFLRIATALGNLQLLARGAQNIQAILAEEELSNVGAAAVPKDHTLRFEGVTFGYTPEHPVLHNITFTALPGQVTAIVGASGAGKTTIARLIPRFWDVTEGRITVGGLDLRECDLDEWLEHVSLVFQDVFLFHGTVQENLRLARPEATQAELEAACRAARCHTFIAALPQGYNTVLGDRGARLSGGEKQRLSIARAFLKDAPFIVLDEATAFADPHSEALIHDALQELVQGKTLFVIAHKLSTIRNADRILVLEEGHLAGVGTHDELLDTTPTYRALWNAYTASIGWTLGGSEEATACSTM